ncbi:uncharacterized protein MELLADRAFT_88474 [Melampsora larici-populina 98AG31]|uniref:Uncharacterized protein n=1 Tax=Melampsora larici-populina (strain 98AG31 / pathotype 3-4-7) TaxID=747676 RepID=F4RRU9_MELLP|nr:uncharacterized protein MELLADRAFT_88474 [Melampsora larici-populina 98AG31]EGG04744.1 hypothetical protein MELLADRAFT_88474 [Melampsora larici-populina 98AG31]
MKMAFGMLVPSSFAYTAIKNRAEGTLPNSLFNVIKLTVAKESTSFQAKHLPAVHQGVEEASQTRRYYSAIKECAKHAREKVHIKQLLEGIHDQKTGEEVAEAVPTIRSMVQRIAVRCGTVGLNLHIDAVYAATDSLTRARIAYLRCEAARIVITGGKGSQSIWACVDKQLSFMRLRKDDDAYAIAFYQIIFDEDCKYFDGDTYFQDLKQRKINLDLPTVEAVMARVAHNAANPQGAPNPNPTAL